MADQEVSQGFFARINWFQWLVIAYFSLVNTISSAIRTQINLSDNFPVMLGTILGSITFMLIPISIYNYFIRKHIIVKNKILIAIWLYIRIILTILMAIWVLMFVYSLGMN